MAMAAVFVLPSHFLVGNALLPCLINCKQPNHQLILTDYNCHYILTGSFVIDNPPYLSCQ